MLVSLLTVTGLSVVVLAVYLLVILGFGHEPGSADREVLGLSIVAAAVVALGASVFHERAQLFAATPGLRHRRRARRRGEDASAPG